MSVLKSLYQGGEDYGWLFHLAKFSSVFSIKENDRLPFQKVTCLFKTFTLFTISKLYMPKCKWGTEPRCLRRFPSLTRQCVKASRTLSHSNRKRRPRPPLMTRTAGPSHKLVKVSIHTFVCLKFYLRHYDN